MSSWIQNRCIIPTFPPPRERERRGGRGEVRKSERERRKNLPPLRIWDSQLRKRRSSSRRWSACPSQGCSTCTYIITLGRKQEYRGTRGREGGREGWRKGVVEGWREGGEGGRLYVPFWRRGQPGTGRSASHREDGRGDKKPLGPPPPSWGSCHGNSTLYLTKTSCPSPQGKTNSIPRFKRASFTLSVITCTHYFLLYIQWV